ncbi:MAG: hypothetical protein HeimC3_23590 [Candidatus Heimdallarchaeota archaeon LC_3]|nr:MAG: hypothetical protein HeimC3_23590 [Candidatus Heimdallarchaeota archaeon LC_3]
MLGWKYEGSNDNVIRYSSDLKSVEKLKNKSVKLEDLNQILMEYAQNALILHFKMCDSYFKDELKIG